MKAVRCGFQRLMMYLAKQTTPTRMRTSAPEAKRSMVLIAQARFDGASPASLSRAIGQVDPRAGRNVSSSPLGHAPATYSCWSLDQQQHRLLRSSAREVASSSGAERT